MAEDKFEKALIKKLEAEGWTYRKDLSGVSTIKIEEHWKEVLNELNAHKLNGVELSDIEFGLIKQLIYTQVKMLFDPPTATSLNVMKSISEELKWRIQVAYGEDNKITPEEGGDL